MPSPKRHAVLAAAGLSAAALAAPAADAVAVGPGTSAVPVAGGLDPVVQMTKRAHKREVRRHVRLHRTNARLRGARPDGDQRREVSDWATTHLRRENRELRRENRKLKRAAAAAAAAQTATPAATTATAAAPATRASTASGGLQSIAACESGGDPSAVDASGTYRGKYQFDMQTWQSVGGSGDPAAAPEAEQDQRAQMLIAQRGSSPWPVCGG